MAATNWGDLVDAFRHGGIGRRDFLRLATAAGISVGAARLLADHVIAQGATPDPPSAIGVTPATSSPSATGAAMPGGRSMNRQELYQLIHRSFELSEPATTGGRVIYGATSDIDTLNPHLGSNVFSIWVSSCIFELLVGVNPTNGFPAPGLADVWELSDDALTYTFHLNPNATWHDGQPVTTADVVFSFDAALDETSLGGVQSTLNLMLDRYRAVDDHTFELVATAPLAVFVENTAALVPIVPRHIWESVPPSDWGTDPGSTGEDPARVVGSGPFRFVEWVTGDHVTLERNEAYWDPEAMPAIDALVFQAIPEASSQIAALTTAEIDLCRIPYGEATRLSEHPELGIVSYVDMGWFVLNMNLDADDTELFLDIPVRQALMYALDRQLIADQIYHGYATPATGPHSPLSIAYAPDRIDTVYTHDPGRARQLLDDAGWVDEDGDGVREKDGVRLAFECLYGENVAVNQQLVPYLQQAWGEVGIAMQPVPLPLQILYDNLAGSYEMAIHGSGAPIDGSLGHLFRCDAVPPAGLNDAHYCNARFDELDDRQLRELDVEKRIDLLVEQANILNNEVASGILVFPQTVLGHRRTLHNFIPNGSGFLWSLPWWWTEA